MIVSLFVFPASGANLVKTNIELKPIAIQDIDTWFRVLNDDTLIVKETRIFNDDVMEVSVMKKEDACESGGKTNIFIASFTTRFSSLEAV